MKKASAMPSGAQMPDDLREALAEPRLESPETVEAMPARSSSG